MRDAIAVFESPEGPWDQLAGLVFESRIEGVTCEITRQNLAESTQGLLAALLQAFWSVSALSKAKWCILEHKPMDYALHFHTG